MKILLVTDAWYPQVNGVVTTYTQIIKRMVKRGHDVFVLNPSMFKTYPCPRYPEIRLALFQRAKVFKVIEKKKPDAIHLATEGPLGCAARAYCRKKKIPYSSSYHTKFPEYLRALYYIPAWISYKYMRWFHKRSSGVLVPTKSIVDELAVRGFKNLKTWTRGIEPDIFKPWDIKPLDVKRPVYMYVGRVSIEKNLDAFLSLKLDGAKVVVGDGPYLKALKKKYPDVVFPGYKKGVELGQYFSDADVFVFPSRTDTFGVVMIEAMACGVPVAAYPVPSPIDVVVDNVTGCLREGLGEAISGALELDAAAACREYALKFTWDATTTMFFENLAVINYGRPPVKLPTICL